MEEEIIYYLFKNSDMSILKRIYNSFDLKSMQEEIFVEGENKWISINSFDDFVCSYIKGNSATVSYSVCDSSTINMISFSYTFDGFLLVGFSTPDSTKVDYEDIEKIFGDIKYLDKKITIEQMPYKYSVGFYN